MESNNLYPIALSDRPDEEILKAFLSGRLPERLIEDFFALFEVVDKPLAIRSSSLLEDSHYQPFAGIYSTYMIPHVSDRYEMLAMLSDAIKGCVCLGVLCRLKGIYGCNPECHRPGENGCHNPGGW